ncbi:helix-turn-helix transcriptional regulator [Duganella sp. PWIR1]
MLLQIYRLAQEKSVATFQDEMLSVVRQQLPFDSSMWGTATMLPTGIDIHSIHLYNTSMRMLEAYEKVKQQDTAALRVTQQDVATIGFNVDDFPGEEQAELRQFLHDFGHLNFAITSDINPRTRFVQWLSLYRAKKEARFPEEEVDFLAALAPHMMQALAINRLVHLDQLTRDTARACWSVGIADQRGVLYHADERFRQLCGAGLRGENQLSGEILSRLTKGEKTLALDGVVLRCAHDQGLLFLRARAREKVDALTAREFLVAKLLASGLTQIQVAERLGRSTETIRSQIKSVFNKLDINSVTLLAGLLAARDE